MRKTIFNLATCLALALNVMPAVGHAGLVLVGGDSTATADQGQAATGQFRTTTETGRLRNKPAKIQITDTITGEVGCLNNDEQVSTPGPCEWPDHSPD